MTDGPVNASHAIEQRRIIAVIRADSGDDAVAVARALHRGGVTLLEIACTTPNAASAIAKLRDLRLTDAVIGAGTVMDEQTARNVIASGAEFVVSPITVEAIVRIAQERNVLPMPGAATPNEVMRVRQLDAPIVKIFPAKQLGGPSYLRALREPMPDLKLCPTGGVSEENLLEYFDAGAVAVGIGGSLADRKAIARRDFDSLTKAAERVMEVLRVRE